MENVELRFINDSRGRCFLVSVDPIKMVLPQLSVRFYV